MTSTRSPLTLLRDHLVQFFGTEAGEQALTRFVEDGLGVDQIGDVLALLGDRKRAVSKLGRVHLFERLGDLAPHDEAAALCAIVSLRPELTWMTRASVRDLVGPEEAEAEVVAVAWEVVTKEPDRGSGPLRHHVMVNAIWHQVCRSTGLRRGRLDIVPLAFDFDQPAPLHDPSERWPGLLAGAVAHGVLTPHQVVVIAQTRMEGRPLIEVAKSLGRTYDSLRMERSRAEADLRQFALAYFEAEEG